MHTARSREAEKHDIIRNEATVELLIQMTSTQTAEIRYQS